MLMKIFKVLKGFPYVYIHVKDGNGDQRKEGKNHF